MAHDGAYRIYLGTYTGTEAAAGGIRALRADRRGAVRDDGLLAELADPSFLAASPDGGALYAVSEQDDGEVAAFAVRPDGSLAELGRRSSGGAAPCHLSVHPSGEYLFTANYGSGTVAVHPVELGGALGEPCDVVRHRGRGPNPQRQESPHAHQVLPDPSGRFVFAVDLGTDSVHGYGFDPLTGRLTPREQVRTRPGAGPRHLAFHPDGERAYLISELESSVTEFGYDGSTGALRTEQSLSTLPPGYGKPNLAAELVITPDGRFAIASNRGHDSLAVFSLDSADGEFRLVEIVSAGVAAPRHIALSPAGDVLFAGGQDSDAVQPFALAEDGRLTPLGRPEPVPSPVCLLPAVG
ncbi:lactonase family protein [Saccharopolyspora cebuensis]|uniref:Lactonase family protein n=1 Tax=Saccharopolyspora cebuensis TaxID=418759 RepID=A0ABV4CBQ5_9PSEU